MRADNAATVPHLYPPIPSDGDPECIAWKCARCGLWVSEYEKREDQLPCTERVLPLAERLDHMAEMCNRAAHIRRTNTVVGAVSAARWVGRAAAYRHAARLLRGEG